MFASLRLWIRAHRSEIAVGVIVAIIASGVSTLWPLIHVCCDDPSGPVAIELREPAKDQRVKSDPPLSGKVHDLQPNQVVWSFNEPRQPGEHKVYPDAGPCRVQNDDFTCPLTNMSIDTGHASAKEQEFIVWVAVVTSDQAAGYAETKAGLAATDYLVSTDSGPPHVGSAIDQRTVICAETEGCRVQVDERPSALITNPRKNQQLPKGDYLVQGSAENLGRDKLWLFDYDPDAKTYTRDNDDALKVGANGWQFLDQELEPGPLSLQLVRADAQCDANIRAIPPNSEGAYVITQLPKTCFLAHEVTVTVK